MAKFRVRARTVDMLGRQQIAGIPTAISELFKNAHDAYARNVEGDYFRDTGLLILRDDGLGMTKKDFEERWLTLGTESKLGSRVLEPPPADPDQPKRPTLGEKGIGRLAIAVIGPQALVLTRAKRNGRPSNTTVAAYLHWGFFELPGVDLDEILIPIRELDGGTLPSKAIVSEMVAEAKASLKTLAERSDRKLIARIRTEMENFNPDPIEYAEILGEPSLTGGQCGTHFYIMPADSIIQDDIDNRQSDDKATRFEKSLIGFTNTMTPGHSRPAIIARFRDYRDEGAPYELIGDKSFFTPEEFSQVDHHFNGRFDEYGQFKGTVGIYQMEPEDYVLPWSEADGNPTECGPFALNFAYLQGQARDSLLPPEEHARVKRKLERYGGLYIYRDGVRVQPYGDSDYDWLDMERNRTLSAGYYVYSFRRLCGAIELTHSKNTNLSEKAGREGFRENRAYRQFRSILMNFFLQTAGDFFREDGKYAETHIVRKAELNKNEEVRRKQAARVREKRASFQQGLDAFFSTLSEKKPEVEANAVVLAARREAGRIVAGKAPPKQKALALMRVEKEGRDRLGTLRKSLAVIKPRGVGLPRRLTNEWASYVSEFDKLERDVFQPSELEIEQAVSKLANQEGLPVDHLVRLDVAVSEAGHVAKKITKQIQSDIDASLTDVAKHVREDIRESVRLVTHAVDEVMAELETLKRSRHGAEGLVEMREELVQKIAVIQKQEQLKLERLREQLNSVQHFWDVDSIDSVELTEALEEELEELRERHETDLELAQVGMALNTISHEFDKTVGSLRDGIRRLKAWADENPEIQGLYRGLRINFEHLDEYLSLFTRLDRRLHRTKVDIRGKEIYDFLSKLFEGRLHRHSVHLLATKQFLKAAVIGYPSSFYPVFVNLVDNSIFWLQRTRDRRKEIILDAEGGDLIVRDTGAGVSARDRDNIFLLHFSRKPGGRGMGLYISREVLAKAGYNLTLDVNDKGSGAAFRVSPVNG